MPGLRFLAGYMRTLYVVCVRMRTPGVKILHPTYAHPHRFLINLHQFVYHVPLEVLIIVYTNVAIQLV